MKSKHSQWGKSTKYILLKMAAWLLFLVATGAASLPVFAQGSFRWSFPQRIPNYDDHSRPPFMVADRAKTLHVFNTQPVEAQQDAIFYRRWSPDTGWTVPIDILLITQGMGGQIIQGVLLDQAGVFHLIYYDESTIRYSSALASIAEQARSWTDPVVIGEGAGPLASAAFIKYENRMTVVYCGRREGIGLYEVHSTDSGKTWSDPTIISLIFNSEQWPTGVRLIQDQLGNLHLTWTNVNTLLGLGEEIYYSRLETDHSQWSNPILLARRDPGDYSAHWASIIEYQGELFVVYQDGFPPTKWMRRSQDHGVSWSLPVRLFPHEGEYEFPVLLLDGSGGLHMLLGNRIGYPSTHGMWHSQWINGSWSNLEPVIAGPKTVEFDPSAPKAVFLQGNILMVTWWNDTDFEHRNGAWYSVTTFPIPELPVTPLPTVTSTSPPPTLELQTVPATDETPTPRPAWMNQEQFPGLVQENYSPSIPLIIGVVAAFLIVLMVFIISRLSYRTRLSRKD